MVSEIIVSPGGPAGAPGGPSGNAPKLWDFINGAKLGVRPLFPWSSPALVPEPADTTFDGIHLAWSPNGQYVAVADGEAQPTVYEVLGGDLIKLRDLPASPGSVRTVAWSPCGEFLAAGSGAPLSLYQKQGTDFTLDTSSFTQPPNVDALTWSPDSRFLAVSSAALSPFFNYYERGTAGFALSVFTKRPNPPVLPVNSCSALAWSPSGRLVACVEDGSTIFAYRRDGPDAADMVKIAGPAGPDQPVGNVQSEGLAWSPDGKYLACDSGDGDIFVYRVEGNGATWTKVATTPAGVFSFNPRWSPDGTKLMAPNFDASPFTTTWDWDAASETLTVSATQIPAPPGADGATYGEWSPDQQFFGLAREFGTGTTGFTASQTGTARSAGLVSTQVAEPEGS